MENYILFQLKILFKMLAPTLKEQISFLREKQEISAQNSQNDYSSLNESILETLTKDGHFIRMLKDQ